MKVKGPQFQLDDDLECERDIVEYCDSLQRGRKSVEIINLMIAGRALSKTCQPVFDLIVSAARRNEQPTTVELKQWLELFSTVKNPAQKIKETQEQEDGFLKLGA